MFAVLIIRLLETATYGTYSTILTIANVGTTLLGFGLSETLVRYLPEAKATEKPIHIALLKNFLAIRLVGSGVAGIILWMVAPLLANWSNDPTIGQLGWLLLVLIISTNISDLLNNYAIANFQLKLSFVVRSGTQLLGIIFTLSWFLLLKPDLTIPLLVFFVSQLVQTSMYLSNISLSDIIKAPKLPLDFAGVVYRYARDTWFVNICTYALAGQFDIIVLSFVLKDSNQVAYYMFVILIWTRIQTLVTGWGTSSITTLSTVYAQNGKEALSRYFNYYYKLSLLSLIPIVVWISAVALALIPLIFQTKYIPSIPLLWLYTAFSTFSVCIAAINTTNFIFVLNRQNRVLIWRITFAVINAILDFILVPQFGALGAVIATGLATTSLHVFELRLVKDVAHMFPIMFLLKILIAVAVAGISAFSCVVIVQAYILGVLLSTIIYGAVLLGMLLILKPFEETDLLLAQNLKPKLANKLRYFVHS